MMSTPFGVAAAVLCVVMAAKDVVHNGIPNSLRGTEHWRHTADSPRLCYVGPIASSAYGFRGPTRQVNDGSPFFCKMFQVIDILCSRNETVTVTAALFKEPPDFSMVVVTVLGFGNKNLSHKTLSNIWSSSPTKLNETIVVGPFAKAVRIEFGAYIDAAVVKNFQLNVDAGASAISVLLPDTSACVVLSSQSTTPSTSDVPSHTASLSRLKSYYSATFSSSHLSMSCLPTEYSSGSFSVSVATAFTTSSSQRLSVSYPEYLSGSLSVSVATVFSASSSRKLSMSYRITHTQSQTEKLTLSHHHGTNTNTESAFSLGTASKSISSCSLDNVLLTHSATAVVPVLYAAWPRFVILVSESVAFAAVVSSVSASAVAVGRIAALRRVSLCQSDDSVANGAGLIMLEIGDDPRSVVRSSNGSIVGNVLLALGIHAALSIVACVYAVRCRVPLRRGFYRVALPSSAMPALLAIIATTTPAVVSLVSQARSLGGSSVGILVVGVLIITTPLMCLTFGAIAAQRTFALFLVRRVDDGVDEYDGSSQCLRLVMQVVRFGLSRRWEWKASGYDIRDGAHSVSMVRALLIEYRVLWYPLLDVSALVLCSVLAGISGLGSTATCRASAACVLIVYSLQLVVTICVRPFTCRFSYIVNVVSLTATVLSVVFQCVFLLSSLKWPPYISAACDLIVVGVSTARAVVEVAQYARAAHCLGVELASSVAAFRPSPNISVASIAAEADVKISEVCEDMDSEGDVGLMCLDVETTMGNDGSECQPTDMLRLFYKDLDAEQNEI